MSGELEAAALDGASGATRPGGGYKTPVCGNCGEETPEKFCPSCGQLASDFHRPIWTLAGTVLADSFALDGRIARTMPALFFRPGRITRAYLDGQRARYVPPFRLFLLASVIFFFTMFTIGDQLGWTKAVHMAPNEEGGWQMMLGEPGDLSEVERPDFLRADGSIDRELLRQRILEGQEDEGEGEGAAELDTTLDRIVTTYENQSEFFSEVEKWSPRLSLLLFPILVATLTLLFAWRRSVYVYDHLITTLHFQSWLYLFNAIVLALMYFITPWFGLALWIAPPVYFYKLMRVVYGSGRILGFLRMAIAMLIALIAFVSILVLVIYISATVTSG